MSVIAASTVIRGSQPGTSHGGVYLVDLDGRRGAHLLGWTRPSIDWSGAGGGRGLRGLACGKGCVYVAGATELFTYQPDFALLGAHSSLENGGEGLDPSRLMRGGEEEQEEKVERGHLVGDDQAPTYKTASLELTESVMVPMLVQVALKSSDRVTDPPPVPTGFLPGMHQSSPRHCRPLSSGRQREPPRYAPRAKIRGQHGKGLSARSEVRDQWSD